MKGRFTRTCFLLGAAIFIILGWALFLQHHAQLQPVTCGSNQLIRLHVLANSDSPEDQQLKLQVRDAIIAYLAPYLENVTDASLARQIVKDHQADMTNVARHVLAGQGADYPVAVQLGMFDFPIKSYGSLVLPAGKYEAVRVLIGRAEGKNWWCVLFPPLCFIDVTHAAALPIELVGDQTVEATETMGFRWKIAEIFRQSNLQQ
ncbi:MAG: stage II sporulation protein R [Veillonellales bacterium]